MSVVVETTIGDLTIDLFTDERPKTCMNFLKLCKMKYFNHNLLFSVERNFIAQMGDPTSSGRGGASVFQNMYGEQARFYEGEKLPIMKHLKLGMVSMASCGSHLFGSQFFITLGENLDSLDGEHLVFGQVVEGLEVISKLNQTLTDNDNRPYQDIRISHTVVLNDPYPDPDSLDYPDESPKPTRDILESDYIAADENIDDTEGKSMDEIQEEIAEREAKARATILEMVGDLPDSDMAPPENVLFVCKLNPVTTSDDLEIIFSRFGKINTCEVIRDRITDNSLQYAFIEFAETKSCEDAYFKMDNVLIDDRRIHVDFSQSVSKIKWRGKGKGVEYFDDSGRKLDGKRGQTFDPNKEHDRQNDRNRNSNRGRGGGWGKDFRPSNGGPRQYQNRDFNKPWDRDNRRYQPWGRNGGMNRNPRESRERYEGGRPFVQDDRDDRYGRRHDGRRNDREEERNNRNKGKYEAKRNEREGKHDEGRNDRHAERYEGRKGEGDTRHYEDKNERHGDKHEHKRSEKESKSNDERNDRSAERHEGRRLEKDDRYEEEKSQDMYESEDRNGKSSEQLEGTAREDAHKRKHSGSDNSDDVPSDNEARDKLLKHLKKSLKKKKKKHKKYDSESNSDAVEDEKERKKKKKKKKKKRVGSESDDSDSDVEVKKKNKKSKKKKKKVSSDSDDSDSDSDSKKKSKKSKKKKKKKKKEALTSDSSD